MTFGASCVKCAGQRVLTPKQKLQLSLNGIGGMTDTVTILREEYEELLSDQKFLELLQAYGVDNWEGYDMAREEFNDD